MHRRALVLMAFAILVGLSGCSSTLGGLIDAVVEAETAAADVKAMATADGEEDCPPLPDPNADPNVYFCQLNARVKYLLGSITCAEYQTAYAACTPGS